jgi:fatty acid desaturase
VCGLRPVEQGRGERLFEVRSRRGRGSERRTRSSAVAGLLLGCAAACGYWLWGMKLELGWLLPLYIYYVNWAKLVGLIY